MRTFQTSHEVLLVGLTLTLQTLPFLIAAKSFEYHEQHLRREPSAREPYGVCGSTFDILPEGAWCLVKKNGFFAPGRPIVRGHVEADAGIAKTVFETVGENCTLIDLGAGIGQYQIYFMNNGMSFKQYLAYDGALNVHEMTFGTVRYLNLALHVKFFPHEISDWVLSLEVGEHIPAQFESIYLTNLHNANRQGIILSWGIPKQGGDGHVNEQPNDEIIKKIVQMGYIYDLEASTLGRSRARYFWFRNTFMVFRRVLKPP